MSKVKPIPEGYHSITPYLVIKGADRAIEYYKKAFGATEIMRMEGPDGKVGHAELKIGDSIFMLGEEMPQTGYRAPQGGSPVGLMLYVNDVDHVFKQAVAAGGRVDKEIKDQFWGDRNGSVYDPFGHLWTVATHIEDVSEDEMKRRMAKFMAEMQQGRKEKIA
ncbi:MAG TPA: VOC family protein [Terriglobales bacterium]|nr:VOC family protein [Terriglobales bacterium]